MDTNALRNFILNDLRYGPDPDDRNKTFVIFESWSDVRKVNLFQGVDSDSERVCFVCKQYACTCPDGSHPPYRIPEGKLSIGQLLAQALGSDENELEWGFSDEYDACSNCSNIIRTSPDSYCWTPKSWTTADGELLCDECTLDDDAIDDIQDAIDNDKTPRSFPSFLDIPEDFVEIKHPQAYGTWESGFHPGQIDNPGKQGKIVRSVSYDGSPVFQVLITIHPSQFDVSWETYFRVDPDRDDICDLPGITGHSLDEWSGIFGELFVNNAKDPYSLADLAQAALKLQVGGKFTTYNLNTETGEIEATSTDDFQTFQEILKEK